LPAIPDHSFTNFIPSIGDKIDGFSYVRALLQSENTDLGHNPDYTGHTGI
ncbi:3642_t:CDS:2, partial [Gigaspora rosea]